MKLESNYIRTVSLGATPAKCGGISPTRYQWKQGKCINMLTGVAYSGDQKQSNCQCLHGSAPKIGGKSAVFDFLKDTFTSGGMPTGPAGAPAITASNLVMPAVVVVGGVAALLLIMKKKK